MQLCGQLRPGRACSDDGYVQLSRPDRSGLRVRPNAGVDQPFVETYGLFRRIQGDGVLFHAGSIEVVADASDADHQRVVAKRARFGDLVAFVVVGGGQVHLPASSIEPDHLAVAVAKMVPMGLREVVQRVVAHIHASGSDFMQQRLPQMRT